jgi:hypothetical protein
MAPVELNIVCFRYRFDQDELADQLNRQIVIQLQESGAVAPSATTIAGRLSIRAAMVNHRTSQTEMDTPGGGNAGRWPGFALRQPNPSGSRGSSGTAGYSGSMFNWTSRRFAEGRCRRAAL